MTKMNNYSLHNITDNIIKFVLTVVVLLFAFHCVHATDNPILSPSSPPQDQIPPDPTLRYQRWLDSFVSKIENSIEEALYNAECGTKIRLEGHPDCEETIKYIRDRLAYTGELDCTQHYNGFVGKWATFYQLDWCSWIIFNNPAHIKDPLRYQRWLDSFVSKIESSTEEALYNAECGIEIVLNGHPDCEKTIKYIRDQLPYTDELICHVVHEHMTVYQLDWCSKHPEHKGVKEIWSYYFS